MSRITDQNISADAIFVDEIDPSKKNSPILNDKDAAFCYYNGQEFTNGAVICQAGTKYYCSNGTWMWQGGQC